MPRLSGLLLTAVLILLAPRLAALGFTSSSLTPQLIQASGLLALGVFEAVQTGALTGLEAFCRIARLGAWNGLLSIPVVAMLVYTYGVSGAIAGLTLSVAGSCLLNGIALRAELLSGRSEEGAVSPEMPEAVGDFAATVRRTKHHHAARAFRPASPGS